MARLDKTENSLAAGQRVFGRYYLTRTLGEGGMGVVWLAHDRVLEQPIAPKFLVPHLVADHAEIERLKSLAVRAWHSFRSGLSFKGGCDCGLTDADILELVRLANEHPPA